MKDNNPVNNGLISSVFGSHRAASGTLDPSVIASGMIDKYGSSVTNARNVQTLMSETKSETNYKKKFASSFDSVFAPFSTKLDESGIPSFGVPTSKSEPNSLTLNPYNPNNALSLAYAPTGSTLYLESLADSGNPTPEETGVRGSGVIANTWIESGHNIIWAHGGSGDRTFYNFDDEFTASTGNFVEVENVRGVGLKAPVVLTGWGFGVDGGPVPADTGDATKFAPKAFSDAGLHKTGPLDVRWDEDRQVWAAGTVTKTYLVKMTNTYNPSHFSYEVQRSDSRSQYSRDTLSARAFSETAPIHDPESIAYDADDRNTGAFERLDYDGLEYPHYEAFIIRETKDEVGNGYYNLFTDDCQDCGHITKSGCGTQHGSSSEGKKILIENPLRQSMNVGDLAFTVKTGRKRKVNTGEFTGGSGTGASGQLETDASGNMSGVILGGGTGYTYGGFAMPSGDICTNVSLTFNAGSLTGIIINPSGGFGVNKTYPLAIYPNDATVSTEELPIHWILQSEFKSQQLVTHVEADGGIMQTCTAIVQTQGFKSCEQCGEDSSLVSNTL